MGKYRIFAPVDLRTGKTTANEFDNYLKGKSNCECFRYDKNTLAIYFPTGCNATNIYLPLLDELGVKYSLYVEGDKESVYHFAEKDIDKIHSVLKFQTKGKNIKPNSVKTARKLNKKG